MPSADNPPKLAVPGRERGYVLLPVVLTIALVAVVAYLLDRETAVAVHLAADELTMSQADYLAAAGLQQALWQVEQAGCGPYSDIADRTFGTGSYSAAIAPNNPGSTVTAYSVPVAADATIKESTPTQNYGSDSQLQVYDGPGDDQRALYRFDLQSAGVPAGAIVVSAAVKLFAIAPDSQDGVELYRVTSNWAENTVTWDGIATAAGEYLGAIPAGLPASQFTTVNVTSLVQGWINGAVLNQGIVLRAKSVATLSEYSSQEYGNGSQRPVLEIKVADGPPSDRADVSVTATLNSGATRTRERQGMRLYQAQSSSLVLQPDPSEATDAYIWEFRSTTNYGTDRETWISRGTNNTSLSLLKFNLSAVPKDARIVSAVLSLYHESGYDSNVPVTAHRITKPWNEDFVTWYNRDSGTPWDTIGGDFDPTAIATTLVGPASGIRYEWDLHSLVQGWTNTAYSNYGVALRTLEPGAFGELFDTSDDADPTHRPRLTVTYTCGCGLSCQPLGGTGNLLLVVGNEVTLEPADTYKKGLFEDWGYSVTLLDDDANRGAFDTAMATQDLVYVSESSDPNRVWDKLAGATIGVVNEEGGTNSFLGTSTSYANSVDRNIEVLDTGHYITALFPAGPLPIYSADMEGLQAAGALATDLRTLGNFAGAPGLAVVETGGTLADGTSTAAGRRVMLPLGRTAGFNWGYLNHNGRLMVLRALQWAAGASGDVCAAGDFRDTFASAAWSNSDGDLDWAGDWIELDDGGSGPTTGKAQIAAGELRLNGPVTVIAAFPSGAPLYYPSLSRETDLSAFESATLSFDFRTGSGVSAGLDSAVVEISPDGGTTWTLLEDFVGVGPSAADSRSYDIGPYSAANTRIRLRLNAGYTGSGDYFYVDNLDIAAGCAPPTPTFCDADYTPDTKVSEFSTAAYGSTQISGLAYLPPGNSFLGVAAPAGGAWIDADWSGTLYMTDLSGTLLTSCTPALGSNEDLTGVTWVQSGTWAGHLAIAVAAQSDYVAFVDPACSIVGSFSTTAFGAYTPRGIGFIGTSASGGYDGDLAIADTSSRMLYLVDQAGTLQASLDLSAFANQVEGVAHLPGSDKLLLADKSSARAYIVDFVNFSGAPLQDYATGVFGPTGPQAAEIDPSSCNHVLGGSNTDKVVALNQGAGAGGGCPGTFRDEFNAVSFANDDGTLSWAGPWQEINEADGASSGDEQVRDDAGPYQLRLGDNDGGGEGVEREADLSGAATAVLSFSYRRAGLDIADDYVKLEISANGSAGPWEEIARFAGHATDSGYLTFSQDISAYISANTRIRLLTSPTLGPVDRVIFDDIQIQCSP